MWRRPRGGRGIGRTLLAEVIAGSKGAATGKMVAVTGDSANTGSIPLHRAAASG